MGFLFGGAVAPEPLVPLAGLGDYGLDLLFAVGQIGLVELDPWGFVIGRWPEGL